MQDIGLVTFSQTISWLDKPRCFQLKRKINIAAPAGVIFFPSI